MTSPRLAIIAALPREIRGLVGRSKPDEELRVRGITLHRVQEAVVVVAGMGTDRATLAFEAALREGSIAEVISVGLAGACTPRLRAGDVGEAGTVVDVMTGERFVTAAADDDLLLATTQGIAGVREKARLAASYGAAMVDMEAATLARLAQAHGMRFRAIKGISDEHDFELASLGRFTGPRGEFRTAAFALHTALRPNEWRMAARLGRDSHRALAALTARLLETMAQSP